MQQIILSIFLLEIKSNQKNYSKISYKKIIIPLWVYLNGKKYETNYYISYIHYPLFI